MTKEFKVDYTTKQAADILGVHRDTVIYWEENGLIPKARRNPRNNYRIYNVDELMEIAKVRGISVVDIGAVERSNDRARKKRSKESNEIDFSHF